MEKSLEINLHQFAHIGRVLTANDHDLKSEIRVCQICLAVGNSITEALKGEKVRILYTSTQRCSSCGRYRNLDHRCTKQPAPSPAKER